jgi:hypothetical protein
MQLLILGLLFSSLALAANLTLGPCSYSLEGTQARLWLAFDPGCQ